MSSNARHNVAKLKYVLRPDKVKVVRAKVMYDNAAIRTEKLAIF
jgi:hypothetical protein